MDTLEANDLTTTPATSSEQPPLRASVEYAIEQYFSHMDGSPVNDLYDMVISEIEEPMLIAVMRFANNNQSAAAKILGLSRGTLRKKLARYDLLTLED